MLVQYSGTRQYLLTALEAAPDIFDHLLRDLTEAEADFRPDEERFSLREVVAHLADWDEIFLARTKRTLAEHEPAFEDHNAGLRAHDRGYAHTHLAEQSQLFREHRARLVEFARGLSQEQWQHHCLHPRLGRVTLEAIVILVPIHDTYHVQQVIEWRRRYAGQQ